MSMLAEPRRKQKASLNPRGKWWTEDQNKFGQKMLEKMGWAKGKGLGANEQGVTEYSIKNVQKNCTSGIGYDENFEKWTENQEKFSGILKQLQENQDIVQKIQNKDDSSDKQSMELKSKESRARVHYKKFTRAKDINKYKSKDLANIFGQEELSSKIQIKKEKKENNYEKEITKSRDNWHGVVTINGGNMTDYFKQKLNCKNMTSHFEYKPNNDLSSNITDNQEIGSESENEQHVGFGFISNTKNTSSSSSSSNYEISKNSSEKSNYAFDNSCLKLNSPMETTSTDDSSKKSSKKRKKELKTDNLDTDEINKHTSKKLKIKTVDSNCSGFTNPALDLNSEPKEDCNGKEFEISRAQFGLENCALDLTDETCDKKRVTFNDHIMLYEYDKNSIKKKKGKHTLDKFEVENKKHKKKQKCESIASPVYQKDTKKAKKKKELETDEVNKHGTRKKLKTETIDSNCNGFTNPALDLNSDSKEDCNDKEFEISGGSPVYQKDTKKAKKKKELETDEVNKHGTRKKLKTETIDSNCNGFTNPALDLNSDSKEDCNGEEFEISRANPVYQKDTKKAKRKKELETDEVNKYSTRKKLRTETIDSNCNGFTNPALDLNADSKEDCNGKEFEISRVSLVYQKNTKKAKRKKELETDEVNKHGTKKKLKTETIDSNCNGFTNPALDLNSDSKEDCNDKEFEISGASPVYQKDTKKAKKKKELETDEVNKHGTRKKLKIETIDSNCNGFINPALDLNSDSKEDCNGEEFEISRANPVYQKDTKKAKRKKELETDEVNKHGTRKKLKIETIDSDCNGFTNPALDLNADSKEDCNGEEFEISRVQFALENCGLDSTDEICDKKYVTKKDKKQKKSKDKNAFDNENSSNPNMKVANVNNIQQEIENIKLTDIFPECEVISVSDQSMGKTLSPLNATVRMSKKMLITLFHKNAILHFPGSNIHEIKGYGADVEC